MSLKRHRFEAKVPIPVLVQSAGQWQAGRVHNLGPRGAFITLEADVWIGEEVKVILGLPEIVGGQINLRALTVWRTKREQPERSEATAGYGLMFPSEPDGDSSLMRAIDRLSQSGLLIDRDPPAGDDPHAHS
jgi:hypothetical protein